MGRIIYAEDDELLAEIAIVALMNAGHAVGWLKNGKAALEAITYRPPDLVILDQTMPLMSGSEVLREMRITADLALVPVLMLTAIKGKVDQNIAYYDGADDYLTKPFDPAVLVDHAEYLMDQNIRRTLATPLKSTRPGPQA